MDRTSLETLLRTQMPLAKAMDVRVQRADLDHVELRCHLQTNHNHLATAFGGSLSTLMMLASYCWLFQLMNGRGHVVLKSSALEFLAPVKEDLRAICLPAPVAARAEFLKAYQKKGKARLNLESQVLLANGKVAARMRGEFVGVS